MYLQIKIGTFTFRLKIQIQIEENLYFRAKPFIIIFFFFSRLSFIIYASFALNKSSLYLKMDIFYFPP